jgi:hypothetical protein
MSATVCITVATSFSGCMQAQITPEMREKPVAISSGLGETLKLSVPSYWIDYKNDTIHLKNGDNIMDEQGHLIGAGEIDGKIYYVIHNESNGHVVLKKQSGETVKDMGESEFSVAFNFGDELYIGTTTKTDAKLYNNVLSKVYKFDGKQASLYKKQVVYSPLGSRLGAGQYVELVGKPNYKKEVIYDFFTGHANSVKPSLVPEGGYEFWGQKMGYEFGYIAGSVGSVIVYSYDYEYYDSKDEKQTKTILEAQNMANGKVAILSDSDDAKFQFLSNKKDVVFKQGNRIIDLATLRPATIDGNFEVVISNDGFANMGGGFTERPKSEYSVKDLRRNKKRQSYLFNYR